MTQSQPILILGAGIHGAAVARQLLLNGVPVCLVDTADIASGATARSSRLIHGGLRYLEYGDLPLVRQSLRERTRLLRLAPHLVRPLRLFIPVENRSRGMWQAAERFFGASPRAGTRRVPRGLWLVRLGLGLYDRYARGAGLPPHAVHRVGEPGTPPVCQRTFRWLCSYFDAQLEFPERLVLAMLHDARRLADQQRTWFRVYPYHRADLHGRRVVIQRESLGKAANEPAGSGAAVTLEPAAIVNATGAWVDQTLRRLNVPSPRLVGGTKGSHFLTANASLRRALAGRGVYAEAIDGRPIFLLPLGELTLVGTTDLPFAERPETAVATPDELQYLVTSANRLFPQAALTAGDIQLHYSGVRPLPYTARAVPAAVPRRHCLQQHNDAALPVYSIVGGKLTTCRAVAEQTAATVLERLGLPVRRDSRDRVFPGAEAYPPGEDQVRREQSRLAQTLRCSPQQVAEVWRLCGTRTAQLLGEAATDRRGVSSSTAAQENVVGTSLPVPLVRYVVRHEWVTHLSDLVERRLMLLYKRRLSLSSLRQLAALMAEEGVLDRRCVEEEVAACVERLRGHYGKRVCGRGPNGS